MPLARRPDPAPLETNDVAIVAGLIGVWAAALVVLLVLKAADYGIHGWWIVMCVEGIVLGLLGLRMCLRRRDAIARDRSSGPL